MSVEAPIQESDNWFVGEDKILRFTVVDAAGAALNIAGYTLEWVLRRGAAARDALITKTSASGIAITDAGNGLCEVTIADDDTRSLRARDYYHTLRRTDAGSAGVLSFGPTTLRLSATR